jgi:hypothetical protein
MRSIKDDFDVLARRWCHNGEDEATVKSGTSETNANDDDGPLFVPSKHFHRQKSSDTMFEKIVRII